MTNGLRLPGRMSLALFLDSLTFDLTVTGSNHCASLGFYDGDGCGLGGEID